jgi:hypothetical protein
MSEITHQEGRIAFAIAAIQKNQFHSIREAARVYNVPLSTLQRRVRGIKPQRGQRSSTRKLTQIEEDILIKWILQHEKRGFPPYLIDAKAIAQRIVNNRSTVVNDIGHQWIYRFTKKHPELRGRISRKKDYQRVKCEDPAIITKWFQTVLQIQQDYGILEQDIYNFDETGFAMGISAGSGASKSVGSSDSVCRISHTQPGDREWITVIETINTSGSMLPPFIIVKGKVQLTNWYTETPEVPGDWVIAISKNGWTNNALSLHWLKHFNSWTQDRTIGRYRLLILDGHKSHVSDEFDQFCEENRILTICMPPHSSHLLQPLDVACFSPLKSAYKKLIDQLVRQSIFHVDKTMFLTMYQQARRRIFSSNTIRSGFRATGLVPFCPSRVLDMLNPATPPATAAGNEPGSSPWTSETPKNLYELSKQGRLIRDLGSTDLQTLADMFGKMAKAAEIAMIERNTIEHDCRELRQANELLSRRRKRKRTQLSTTDPVTVENARQMV